MATPLKSVNTVFNHVTDEGFEQVVFCHDKVSGLRSIISIHNTKLGPSLGGCRFFNYPSETDALEDSLRLAQAMTYKAALAGLALGGGKAVIFGDPTKDKSSKLWKAYASSVDRLGGAYITTVDSGTSSQDMDEVRKYTKYVVGVSQEKGGSGDPSPTTALGVAEGIRASAKFVFGSDSLANKRVAVQGLGHVGFPLARMLKDLGASLVVADKYPQNLERAVKELGAEVVNASEIIGVKCDILAPCAMGGVINEESIGKLKCAIVAGAANNQLESERDGEALEKKGISYAPDFAINAGGLIHVSSEWGGFDAGKVEDQAKGIYDTILKILKKSRDSKRASASVAIQMAKEHLASK